MTDRELLELTDKMFLESGKEKEDTFCHIVSSSLVFSLGLLRGPATMCLSQTILAKSE